MAAAYTSYGAADKIIWRLTTYEVYGGLRRRLGALFQVPNACLTFEHWKFQCSKVRQAFNTPVDLGRNVCSSRIFRPGNGSPNATNIVVVVVVVVVLVIRVVVIRISIP